MLDNINWEVQDNDEIALPSKGKVIIHVEKNIEPSCFSNGVYMVQPFWKMAQLFLKMLNINYHIIKQFYSLWVYPRELAMCSCKKKTCTCMFARGLLIMFPMETVFVPLTWWMNKGSMCMHDEITFYKQQRSTDMCYNLARPWKSYAEWKKPVKTPQIVSLHLCEMFKVGKSRKMKSRLVIFQPFEEKWGVTVNWYQVSFWGSKNILRIRWWQCWAALGIH